MSRRRKERDPAEWAMALLDVPGLGPARIKTLVDAHGSLKDLVDVIEGDSDNDARINAIRDEWGSLPWDDYSAIRKRATELGATIYTLDHPAYPGNLKNISTPPPLLYVRGTLDRLSNRALALVGTTQPSERGRKRARKFARKCVEYDIQVISGLARGIDTESHRATLAAGGVTFAVVGHGLAHLYPPENEELAGKIAEQGAIISQFPPDTPPARWTFPARNEVMCALSLGTTIIEIEQKEKKGSVVQARFSQKHGRPVFILDSNIAELESPVAEALVEEEGATRVREFQQVVSSIDSLRRALEQTKSQMTLSLEQGKDTAMPASTSPQALDALLWDFDGVLLDSSPSVVRAFQSAIQSVAGRKVTVDELRHHAWDSPAEVLGNYGISWGDGGSVFNRSLMQHLQDGHWERISPVVDFAYQLKRAGLPLGVVTSQPRGRFDTMLRLCELEDLFEVSVTWSDVPRGKTKPEPESLEQAMQALSVASGQVAYIGDSVKDVLAARNAGIRSVGVCWGSASYETLKRFNPDVIVREPEDISRLMEDLVAPAG